MALRLAVRGHTPISAKIMKGVEAGNQFPAPLGQRPGDFIPVRGDLPQPQPGIEALL